MANILTTKIVLIGSTGEGKSCFGNYLLKIDENKFIESNKAESCTEDLSCRKGKKGTEVENIYIIDTPGFNDSKGRDEDFIKKMTEGLKFNYHDEINCFLFLFNINKSRITFELKKNLYYYCLMFPIKDFWSHVGIVFTFSYEYFPDEQFEILKKEKTDFFLANLIEIIKSYVEDINNLNGFNIIKPEKLKIFFTDCGELIPPYTHKRTDKEIKRIIDWSSKLPKLNLRKINNKIKVNFKYYKEIGDLIKENKIYINSNKYKNIKKYFKQYKTIDFDNKTNIFIEPDYYKEEIKYYKLYKYENTISDETRILNEDFYEKSKNIEHYERWNEIDINNNIMNYGKKENIKTTKQSKTLARNLRVFNCEYKTEYDHIISYDYQYEYETKWILFIPITIKYKQPYRLVQNIYYKKEDKIDDLNYKKYGDWVVKEYGNTRKDYYTSRYKV